MPSEEIRTAIRLIDRLKFKNDDPEIYLKLNKLRKIILCLEKDKLEVQDPKQKTWDQKEVRSEVNQEQGSSVPSSDPESLAKEQRPRMPSMVEANHRQLVEDLCKKPIDILQSLGTMDCHLIHMALGISGEAGELLDSIKKTTMYCKPIDIDNIVEELGDLEFYMEGLRNSLNITREQVLEQNISKLRTRYGDKYSNKAAQDRIDKT